MIREVPALLLHPWPRAATFRRYRLVSLNAEMSNFSRLDRRAHSFVYRQKGGVASHLWPGVRLGNCDASKDLWTLTEACWPRTRFKTSHAWWLMQWCSRICWQTLGIDQGALCTLLLFLAATAQRRPMLLYEVRMVSQARPRRRVSRFSIWICRMSKHGSSFRHMESRTWRRT